MTMGPEPRIRILEMSVRLGIYDVVFHVRFERAGFQPRCSVACFERARLQVAPYHAHPHRRALAPEVEGLARSRRMRTNTENRRNVRTSAYAQDSPECRKRAAGSPQHREYDDPRSPSAKLPCS